MRGTDLLEGNAGGPHSQPTRVHSSCLAPLLGGAGCIHGAPRGLHQVLVETHEAREQHNAGQALVHHTLPLAQSSLQPAITLGPEAHPFTSSPKRPQSAREGAAPRKTNLTPSYYIQAAPGGEVA